MKKTPSFQIFDIISIVKYEVRRKNSAIESKNVRGTGNECVFSIQILNIFEFYPDFWENHSDSPGSDQCVKISGKLNLDNEKVDMILNVKSLLFNSRSSFTETTIFYLELNKEEEETYYIRNTMYVRSSVVDDIPPFHITAI